MALDSINWAPATTETYHEHPKNFHTHTTSVHGISHHRHDLDDSLRKARKSAITWDRPLNRKIEKKNMTITVAYKPPNPRSTEVAIL